MSIVYTDYIYQQHFCSSVGIYPGSGINKKRVILIIGDNRGRAQGMIFYNAILERSQLEVSTIIILFIK